VTMKQANNQMNRTLIIKLDLEPNMVTSLKHTQTMYRDCFNKAAQDMVNHKSVNRNKCQTRIYNTLRAEHPELPSQLVIRAIHHASSMIKSWNTNVPGRNQQRKQINNKRTRKYGLTAKLLPMLKKWEHTPHMSEHASMNYDLRVSTLRGEQLTFSHAGEKRIQTIITMPNWWKDRINSEWKYKALQLKVTKTGEVYAHLNFVTTKPETKTTGDIVGLDRGPNNIIATSNGELYSGKENKARRRKHLHNRKQLQSKGTRSAKRRLRQLSKKEQRFGLYSDHKIAKQLASQENVACYVLEDLSKLAKQAKTGSKKSNKVLSDWSHARLLTFITYKCEAKGIKLVFVDPKYTSQECSQCGYTDRQNRHKSRFCCLECGFITHADVNAAINIRERYLSSLAIASEAGASQCPNVDARKGGEHARKSSVDGSTVRRLVGNQRVGSGPSETTSKEQGSLSQATGLTP